MKEWEPDPSTYSKKLVESYKNFGKFDILKLINEKKFKPDFKIKYDKTDF